MKKFLLSAGVALLSVGANAQVGINAGNKTDAPQYQEMAPDAILQVANKKGESKGVLLPSVSLQNNTDQSTITKGTASTVSKGLIVWNDGENSNLAEGYYYWNGTQWQKLGGANSRGIGAVYEKVRIFKGPIFKASDIQPDDYIIAFTDAEGFAMPKIDEKKEADKIYKNRTICIRNATSVPFGTGAKQVVMSNVVSGQETINSGFTRCYTSFKDANDKNWYWISTSL